MKPGRFFASLIAGFFLISCGTMGGAGADGSSLVLENQNLDASYMPVMAVHEFAVVGFSPKYAEIFTEKTVNFLSTTNVFRVIRTSDRDMLTKEQEFAYFGYANEENAKVKYGQLLGAELICLGKVSRIGDIYSLSLRIINVSTGIIELGISPDFMATNEKSAGEAITVYIKSIVANFSKYYYERVIKKRMSGSSSSTPEKSGFVNK